MRKKSIQDGRPARHDDLVADLLGDPAWLIAMCGAAGRIDSWGMPKVEIEAPVGRGHVDVLMTWIFQCGVSEETNESEKSRNYRQWMPGDRPIEVAPCAGRFKTFLVCEVKSELEKWSAGDVIRQLKGYRENLGFKPACDFYPSRARHRLNPTSHPILAIYSGRPFSTAEVVLFHHANVAMVLPASPGDNALGLPEDP